MNLLKVPDDKDILNELKQIGGGKIDYGDIEHKRQLEDSSSDGEDQFNVESDDSEEPRVNLVPSRAYGRPVRKSRRSKKVKRSRRSKKAARKGRSKARK